MDLTTIATIVLASGSGDLTCRAGSDVSPAQAQLLCQEVATRLPARTRAATLDISRYGLHGVEAVLHLTDDTGTTVALPRMGVTIRDLDHLPDGALQGLATRISRKARKHVNP
ncbi:MAG: hypothetical protein Q4G24_07200 [Paracoccus sp. (in: a-proteobacteria)]|uniref:hypothetical protein n=1 Tax=Paracoccus sp. TaxID=267 RepID=UPI0026DEE319|nr:hypothetical protein [Paracoccus sp. (in: a-proteobacteria)]MDO5621240.1 hypothetical protein [Paracoccus sp. (in: a-proteobacteria)]